MAVGSLAKGRAAQKATSAAAVGEEKLEDRDGGGPKVVRVSKFDYSVENHLNAMDRISELCGEAVEEGGLDESEIRRFSSSLTFLRDWRVFNYQPRDVKFASEAKKEVAGATNLPQFSSAAVPQEERLNGDATSMEPRDFVMYVGGHVWGLDWCPRVHESPDSTIKREFIAIAAHPPGSSYHKIGAPLSGKGLVQIWSLLNVSGNEGEIPPLEKPQRGRKKSAVTEEKPSQVKRPRGRPRKKPLIEHTARLDGKDQYIEPLGIQVPENSSDFLAIEGVPGYTQEISVPENHGEKQSHNKVTSKCDLTLENTVQRTVKNKAGEGNDSNEHNKSSISSQQILGNSGEDPGRSNNVSNDGLLEISSTSCLIPNDITLPRVVLCLAHNGRVAWDLKWRPCNPYDSKCKHQMGFLAVLLGNGSLEVWEIPHPNTIKVLYSSLNGEGTDPRFVKLEPVFRCSMLKSGGTQSIPLTVEWSTLPPHQFLLAGCHDGTVALWKFSENVSSKDTRPLLCFSADTVPIRAVAWAPVESDSESANVIVTAGHGDLKFWDLRDPFRPLWDFHPVPRIINSLDWLPDPRCVILSFDDGTMRTLSLTKAAYDVHVTGKPFVGTKLQGLHTYSCLSFALWSIQVSRATGMVAYCSADGNVLRFQLTMKAVDKDGSRNHTPHFLCGSLTEDESTVTINTPVINAPPVPLKKSLNKCGDTRMALRDILSRSNRAKREDDKMEEHPASNEQALALCYGDDSGVESELEETLASLKRKKPSKSKSHTKKRPEDNLALALVSVDNEPRSSKRKESLASLMRKKSPKSGSNTKKLPEDNLALVSVDDEPRSSERKEIEKDSEFEVFPSKAIAMHRVRWNMNKGSERWLCYGGAAGVVRCQEIALSDVEKKLAKKR